MRIRLPIAVAIASLMGAIIGVQAAAVISVAQHGLLFNKTSTMLTKGDRMLFANEDDVIHNIHIFGPGEDEKDLGLQKPGATLSYTFDKAGPHTVRCNIHPSTKMAVTVK
jgi:plastocyanin